MLSAAKGPFMQPLVVDPAGAQDGPRLDRRVVFMLRDVQTPAHVRNGCRVLPFGNVPMKRAGAVGGQGARQRGSGLIEVLVAVILLSLGMLAMLRAQASAMTYERTAEFRGVAAQLASDVVDRIRANASGAQSYIHTAAYDPQGNIPKAAKNCAQDNVTCSAAEMAAHDMAWMRANVRSNLPGGDLRIADAGSGRLNIWVLWVQTGNPDLDAHDDLSYAGFCPQQVRRSNVNVQCLPVGMIL